jgi:hypothetical protein
VRNKIPYFLLFFFAFGLSQKASPTVVIDSLLEKKTNLHPTDSILRAKPTTDNTLFDKKFAPDFRKKYRSDEFDYTRTKPHESIWSRIKKSIYKIISRIWENINPIGSLDYIGIIVKVLVIVIIGLILYFLVKFLISKDGNLFFSKKNMATKISDENITENIHEINFSKEIANYELEKKYRLAIRYQFLWVLKKLSDTKKIQWNIEKTNKDYVNQLSSTPLHTSFVDLVNIFNFVWYGEFSIEENKYKEFKQKFENFLK